MRNSLFLIALASAVLLACGPARRPFDPSSAGGPTYVDPPGVHLEDTHITIDDTIQFAHDSDEILQHHPEITALRLIGHTDSTGSAAHNMDLSSRRAASVKAALEQRGVTQPISSSGAGMTQPLCEEDTDECRARNRRVEFQIDRSDR